MGSGQRQRNKAVIRKREARDTDMKMLTVQIQHRENKVMRIINFFFSLFPLHSSLTTGLFDIYEVQHSCIPRKGRKQKLCSQKLWKLSAMWYLRLMCTASSGGFGSPPLSQAFPCVQLECFHHVPGQCIRPLGTGKIFRGKGHQGEGHFIKPFSSSVWEKQ